jgi:hypothetical protein
MPKMHTAPPVSASMQGRELLPVAVRLPVPAEYIDIKVTQWKPPAEPEDKASDTPTLPSFANPDYKSFEEVFPRSGKLPVITAGEGIAILKTDSGSNHVTLDDGAFRLLYEYLQAEVKNHWGSTLASQKAAIRALHDFRKTAEQQGTVRGAAQTPAEAPAHVGPPPAAVAKRRLPLPVKAAPLPVSAPPRRFPPGSPAAKG